MVGWYARFIKNESSIKILLVKLLRKSKEWQWGEDQEEAFQTLKRALIEKTYDRVAREYYWKVVYHDVHTFVRECDLC